MRRLLLFACATAAAACSRPAPPVATPQPPVSGPRAAIEPAPTLPQRLRIIGTNDFHGALESRPDDNGAMRGGAATLAAYIRQAERECRLPDCATLLVDGGDMFQGTPGSNIVYGRPVVDIYNKMGYSAAAIGNHEFDWGQDTLRARMRDARFPMLGANIRSKFDGRDIPWIPNDTLVERGPFKIGIIGVSTVETPTTTEASKVADLTFVDPVPLIDSLAPALRARGAHFVVVIGHISARCTAGTCTGEAADIANRVTAKIDAIVSGHSHTRAEGAVKGIPIVQARSRGWAIDIIDLFTTGAAPSYTVRDVYADSVSADADVTDIVIAAKQHVDKVAPHINRPIATIATTMRNSLAQPALGNLIADAMRVVGGGDLAIMNSGGVRQTLLAGTATYGTLFEVQPFGNKLTRVRVTGENLRTYFAQAVERGINFYLSGARLFYHATPTPGLDSLHIQGRPVSPQATYTVVLNDFSANGGDRLGFGTMAISTLHTDIVDLDALLAYLPSLQQPVRPPAGERIVRKP